MGLRERLEQLEQPPPGCDILDVDLLLRECGYECHNDGFTRLYTHEGWHSFLTFPATKTEIPHGQLQGLIAFVRWKLEKEGRL